jgi:hypothetical protein
MEEINWSRLQSFELEICDGKPACEMKREELTREYVSRWAIITDEAWNSVPEQDRQRFLREALYTVSGIADLSANILVPPMTVGYDFNTRQPLVTVTSDLTPHLPFFRPIWLWRYEQTDDKGRCWVYNLVDPHWCPATDNQVRAYLLTRLVGKGKFARARDVGDELRMRIPVS